jgi:hypothetical protein
MPAVLRHALAVVIGVVVAVTIIMLFEGLNSQFFPPPPGLEHATTAEIAAWLRTLPTGAFLMVLAGYAFGAFAGSAATARFAPSRAAHLVGLFGAFLLVASLMNLVALPHPVWFWVANVLLIVGGAWLGLRLGARRAIQPG